MQVRESLLRYPLFALLAREAFESLLKAGNELCFSTGETIFQEKTFGAWAYLIVEGRVRLLRRGQDERELSLGVLGPGELFGEYALVAPGQNTATCRATETTRVVRFPLSPLRELLADFPVIRKNLKNWLRLHSLLGYLGDRTFLGFMSAGSALGLLDHLRPEHFAPEHTIQADGLSVDRWYYIKSGAVALQGKDDAAPRMLGPGESFGEHALIGTPELPTATSLVETHCLSLERGSFDPSYLQTRQLSLQSISSLDSPRPQVWIGQETPAECGVASLAMILRSHGRSESFADVRARVRIEERGARLSALQTAAQELGLHCKAVRVDPDHLNQLVLPVIVHQSDGHYVVLFSLDENGVEIGDPATGKVRLSLALFQQRASGNFLVFK